MNFVLDAEQKLHTLEQKMAELSEGSGSKKISNEKNKHMNMKLKLYEAIVVDYQAKMLEMEKESELAKATFEKLQEIMDEQGSGEVKILTMIRNSMIHMIMALSMRG